MSGDAQRREETREAWRGWHPAQAERVERTASALAAGHRRRAGTLLGAATPGEGGR